MAISGDQQMPQMQPPSLLYFFDLNTVFTISFAVFFFTAGVYFVLRSCCRSWRDSDQEVEEDGDAQRAAETKPACVTQVRAISVVLFDAGGGEAEENCPVCLEQYERGAELRVMPQCGHAFHRACVDLWLLTKSSFCPICRVRVVERGVEPIDDWYPDYQLRRKQEGSRRISCPPKHTLHIVIAEISKDERLHNFIEEDHWWPQTIAKPVSKRPRVSRT